METMPTKNAPGSQFFRVLIPCEVIFSNALPLLQIQLFSETQGKEE